MVTSLSVTPWAAGVVPVAVPPVGEVPVRGCTPPTVLPCTRVAPDVPAPAPGPATAPAPAGPPGPPTAPVPSEPAAPAPIPPPAPAPAPPAARLFGLGARDGASTASRPSSAMPTTAGTERRGRSARGTCT